MSVDLIKEGSIAKIVINRPEKYNAMSEKMKGQLQEICLELNFDRDVRAVLLYGEGKSFCSGGDVASMQDSDLVEGRRRCKHAHSALLALYHLEKPVVCAVRGWVAGAGLAMMLCSDLIVASDNSKFSAIFKKIGLAPDSGAVYLLSQYLGVQRAKELVMTARTLMADEAHNMGLVSSVVPDKNLLDEALKITRELAEGPTYALTMTKKMFQAMGQPSLEQMLEIETWVQTPILMTEDHKEGISAFMEKRPAHFIGK